MIYDRKYDTRTVPIIGTIEPVLVTHVILKLEELMEENDEPIKIYLSSPGGDVNSGLALYDFIRNTDYPISTYALGEIASMASIIFLAAKDRIMMPSSSLMLHDMSMTFQRTFHQLSSINEHHNRLHKILENIILERTNITKKELEKIMIYEKWFSPEEALKKEICTEVAGRSK